jgi:hypothetical protein
MKKLIFFLIFLPAIGNSQIQEMDYVDFLHGCLSDKQLYSENLDVNLELSQLNGKSGFFLTDAKIILGSFNEDDFDFTLESGYAHYSLNHPILKTLRARYPSDPIELDSLGRLIIRNNILIKNVRFESLSISNLSIEGKVAIYDIDVLDDYAWIENNSFEGLTIGNPLKGEAPLRYFYITNNDIGTASFNGKFGEWIEISENKFNTVQLWSIYSEYLLIDNNTFDPKDLNLIEIDSNYYNNVNRNQHVIQARDIRSNSFAFSGNTVLGQDFSLSSFHLNSDNVNITGNTIKGTIMFNEAKASDRFNFYENTISGKVSFNEFIFSETYNKISWFDINDKMVSLSSESSNDQFDLDFQYDFNELGSDIQFEDSLAADNLIRDYYHIYSIFKQNGNLRYANACYSEMKQLETARLGYVYQQNGGSKNWFRWKLGQLLKFYTENGTDPAKALVVSVYIILLFGILYFFYPSDWDVTSKSKLIENIKSAISKHEKGTGKAIIKSLGLFILSLVNALTLSLNSFVTLGFGTIPTYGFARYICIIQGFIGWFLLSLFTVSLINQVLF